MPVVINGTTGINTDGQGNLTFSGTGQRITGDFTNATIANRVMFQTSTANSTTAVGVLPNGTGQIARIQLFSNSDPTNASVATVSNETSDVRFTSGIAGTGTFLPMTFYTGGSERMRLDTSGNLGLGVTPSAWGTTKALEFSYGSFSANSSLGTDVAGNCYYNGTNWIYRVTGVALRYNQATAGHSWHVASGTAGNVITFTQAMTLDASGNLGVGTTSPSGRVSSAVPDGATNALYLERTGGAPAQFSVTFANQFSNLISSGVMTFAVNGSERARIISSGDLLVGKTSLGSTAGLTLYGQTNTAGYARIDFNKTSSGTFTACEYNHNGTPVGTITYSNTATAYNTSSDYRLKENIQPMTGALAKVAALKPCTYKWKADGSDGEGFIAHELAEVVPQCVTGEKDAVDADGKPVYQGIDTSFLVATLTAAIQELKAELDTVKTELAALKGTA